MAINQSSNVAQHKILRVKNFGFWVGWIDIQFSNPSFPKQQKNNNYTNQILVKEQ